MNNRPDQTVITQANRIALLLPSLEGGGAERSMLNLAAGLVSRGRQVELILCKGKGSLMDQVPEGVSVVILDTTPGIAARALLALRHPLDALAMLRPILLAKKNPPEVSRIPAIRRYLQQQKPDALLSALTYANLAALWAAGSSSRATPVIVSERIALWTSCHAPNNVRKWRWRYAPQLVRRIYPRASAVVTVSQHAADELTDKIGLQHARILPLNNPVVDDRLRRLAAEPLDHPWFADGSSPVILSAGRLTEQKDFRTLLSAFALVRAKRAARLVILGEGRLRDDLNQQANTLGIEDDIDFPGFVDNPFKYMNRASAFVLPSLYEGLPGVLIQAMACGCPLVSTNSPGGSSDILQQGTYGELVKVGDAEDMARGILAQLENPTPREQLLSRAEDFSVEGAVDKYLALLDLVASETTGHQ